MMNAKLYQVINTNYKNILDEDDTEIINNYFSYCREESINLAVENNLDYCDIYERFITAYDNNCNNINILESQIIKAKSYIEEKEDFQSKDDEILHLKSTLNDISKELSLMQETIDSLTDNHTVILDSSSALFGIYNLNMYAFDKSVTQLEKSYDECINSTETISFLEGYMKCNENNKSIIDRINELDNSLTETIRRN